MLRRTLLNVYYFLVVVQLELCTIEDTLQQTKNK